MDGHRPWPRVAVADAAGARRSITRRRPMHAARACGAMRARCTWRCWTKRRREIDRRRSNRLQGRDFQPSARGSAGHSPRTRHPQSVRTGGGRLAGHTAVARPRLLGRRASTRQRREAPSAREPYAFLPAEGEGLHQIPVGPVHAGIIEPGHFRFTANGEHVVRLEQRLGYVHKGIESLMAGATLDRRRTLAGRTSGDSTVAYSLRVCAGGGSRAAGAAPPPRALYLRALMAELERLANHFGDIGAICNDASFSSCMRNAASCASVYLRAGRCLLRPSPDDGCVVPGGVARDHRAGGSVAVARMLA